MSSHIWTAADSGSVTFTWLGYATRKKEIHPYFSTLKNWDFLFSCPTRSILRSGMTQKFCVCGRAPAAQPRQNSSATNSALLQGRGRDRQNKCEVRGWQRGGCALQDTHTPHSSLQAQDGQRGAVTAFSTAAAVPVGAAALKKTHIPVFSFPTISCPNFPARFAAKADAHRSVHHIIFGRAVNSSLAHQTGAGSPHTVRGQSRKRDEKNGKFAPELAWTPVSVSRAVWNSSREKCSTHRDMPKYNLTELQSEYPWLFYPSRAVATSSFCSSPILGDVEIGMISQDTRELSSRLTRGEGKASQQLSHFELCACRWHRGQRDPSTTSFHSSAPPIQQLTTCPTSVWNESPGWALTEGLVWHNFFCPALTNFFLKFCWFWPLPHHISNEGKQRWGKNFKSMSTQTENLPCLPTWKINYSCYSCSQTCRQKGTVSWISWWDTTNAALSHKPFSKGKL